MSEENIELVRNAYDLWNRGDLDAFMGRLLEYFWDHQEALEAAGLSE